MNSMRVCVITDRSVKSISAVPECDVVLFGFGCLGEVDYESELSGKSDKFEEAARLSKAADCGVICACRTVGRGIRRKSCAVCDRGKLLGISDMTHTLDDEDCKSGAYMGLYTVRGYRVGLCVENDVFFPEGFRALSVCGCNLICVVREGVENAMPPLLIRAYSYLYGVPVVMCAGRTAYFTGGRGGIAVSNQSMSLFEASGEKSYRLVGARTAGLRDGESCDY